MKMRLFKAVLLATGLFPGLAAAQVSGLPMAGFAAGGTGLAPFFVLGFELGPWQDYLAMELTPDYMADPAWQPLDITWMDTEVVMILPVFAEQLFRQPRTRLQMQIEWQHKDPLRIQGMDQARFSPGFGYERQMLTQGIFHQLNENQFLGVSAVLAYQSYGTSALGIRTVGSASSGFSQGLGRGYDPYQESGYGTGIRLALHSEVVEGVAIDAGYQSRIDMEEFANYRGVYAHPADLDIPARASVGLAFQTNSQSWLNFSVERVLYSEVNAFPGRTLPDRFLSLLGDSTSPSFAWDDLTVYTVGWTWNNGDDTQWHVDFRSRSQPLPTSATLSRALSGDLAENAMTVGYARRMGDRSRFNINAAYAPAEYAFGGNVLGVTNESLDQNLEVEAFWTWDF